MSTDAFLHRDRGYGAFALGGSGCGERRRRVVVDSDDGSRNVALMTQLDAEREGEPVISSTKER